MKTAIYSDDPQAIAKLERKIAVCEITHRTMKFVNAAYRKAGRPAPDDAERWAIIEDVWQQESAKKEATIGAPPVDAAGKLRMMMARAPWEKMPFPTWELSNNNANIRRMKARIAEIEGGRN